MLFSKKHPERGEGLRLDGAPGGALRKLAGRGAEPPHMTNGGGAESHVLLAACAFGLLWF